MSAYVIVDVDVHDPSLYEQYKALTPGTLAAYGGRFVVRGGAVETLEGDWAPGRIVVLEFADAARAKAWWASATYAEAKRLRQRAATTRMIVVEGV